MSVAAKNGQNTGETVLDIEARIGQLTLKEEQAKVKADPIKGPTGTFIGRKNPYSIVGG